MDVNLEVLDQEERYVNNNQGRYNCSVDCKLITLGCSLTFAGVLINNFAKQEDFKDLGLWIAIVGTGTVGLTVFRREISQLCRCCCPQYRPNQNNNNLQNNNDIAQIILPENENRA